MLPPHRTCRIERAEIERKTNLKTVSPPNAFSKRREAFLIIPQAFDRAPPRAVIFLFVMPYFGP
jgi:hypothetical protein